MVMSEESQTPAGLKFRKHPHLMEINTWVWLDELSRQANRKITLAQIPNTEWDRLKALGFDLIWLMGVWKRSAASRAMFRTDSGQFPQYDRVLPGWRLADVVGSPFSIQDYVPDPYLGDWDELDAVRKQLHQRGLGLILDFVPNHTAPDHAWVQSHPEYYVQSSEEDFRRDPSSCIVVDGDPAPRVIARGKDPYLPAWPDTAQLNYFNPETRAAMVDIARTIARHSDGVRCDMAMLIVNAVFARTWGDRLSTFQAPAREFWPDLTASLPDFVWIAEVYWDMEWQLQQMGFQFTYDKRFYDRLRSFNPADILAHLCADLSYQTHLLRFLENHDEERSAAVFADGKLQAAATLVATLPGLRFYHQGQLEGRKIHLPIPLSRAADESPDPTIQSLYEKLLEISNQEIFHEGDWALFGVGPAGDQTSGNLIGYGWDFPESTVIVVVNLSPQASQARILPKVMIDHVQVYRLTDTIHGITFSRIGQEIAENGIYLKIEPYGFRIFDVRPQASAVRAPAPAVFRDLSK